MTFFELALLVALTILALALAVIAFFGYCRNWQWTGLPKYGDDDVERRYVTLWAWISVLLVPLTLAAAGVLFTGAQHRSSSAIQQQQREHVSSRLTKFLRCVSAPCLMEKTPR